MQPSTRGTTSKARDPSGDLDTAVGEALLPGVLLGFVVYALVRILLRGFYTVDQNERAVKTVFGRAQRVGQATTLDLPSAQALRPDERERYVYPQAVVIPPGGPYFKWPWEQIHKVNVATTTMNLAHDPDNPEANEGGTRLDAVTKDHLNTKIIGQLRFRVAEENLYAFLFGVKSPIAHVMGYFVSVLRQRIASFEAPARALLAPGEAAAQGLAAQGGVSINDLRKNLRELNDHMEADCASSSARYGVLLDACLITGIDPPDEVESALAAINTAHNHVSSELSLAHAAADQRIVQSRRAVEIETLQVQAEAEPLQALSRELVALDASGPGILEAYVRNQKLALLARARRVFLPAGGAPLPRVEGRSFVPSGEPIAALGGREFTPAEGPPMTARLGARTSGGQ
jgi:regulator of protease activity HflC (stomatin/prohibitin superfamily)